MNDEIGELEPLTPFHLIQGRTVEAMPPLMTDDLSEPLFKTHEDLNCQYSQLSSLICKFNKLWRDDYLTALRERHYGSSPAISKNTINIGDVVIVHCDKQRANWPLGKIIEIIDSKDNVIRMVKLKLKDKELIRSIDKLVPLEINNITLENNNVPLEINNAVSDADNGIETEVENELNLPIRKTREASKKASQYRQDLIKYNLI